MVVCLKLNDTSLSMATNSSSLSRHYMALREKLEHGKNGSTGSFQGSIVLPPKRSLSLLVMMNPCGIYEYSTHTSTGPSETKNREIERTELTLL